jgi:hypothetical protein
MFSFQYTLESHENFFRSLDADWLFNSPNTDEMLYLGGIDITYANDPNQSQSSLPKRRAYFEATSA